MERRGGAERERRPTVCIIGAGVSGLRAGRSLTDAGIHYACFEASDRIGGNWAFKNPRSVNRRAGRFGP